MGEIESSVTVSNKKSKGPPPHPATASAKAKADAVGREADAMVHQKQEAVG